jgi:hypothetical protein
MILICDAFFFQTQNNSTNSAKLTEAQTKELHTKRSLVDMVLDTDKAIYFENCSHDRLCQVS